MLHRMRSALSALEWRILLTALFVLAAFAQVASSEGKRSLELTESMVIDHSLALDGVVVRDGFVAPTTASDGRFPPPVGEAHDRSFYDGHYYLGAAPGLSVLMLPATAVLEGVGARTAPAAWKSRFVRYGVLHLANVFVLMLPISLLTLLFVHRTHERMVGDPRQATLLTFVYAFGTIFFFYGVQPNVWQIVNCITWAFVYFALLPSPPLGRGAALGFGFGAAIAVSMNYFAGVLLLLFGATLLVRRDFRAILLLGAGFFVGMLPLFAYHQAVFDSPLSTPYSHRIDKGLQRLMASGVQGFFLPSPLIALKLLFHPNIGLFVYAPITVLSLVGARHAKGDRVLTFALAGAAMFLLLISGRHEDYHSGEGGFGSRYLVPMLPFVWLLVVGAFRRVPARLFEGLAIVSVVISLLGAMFGAKLLPLSVGQFVIRGIEVPSLVWLKQVLDEYSTRRPPMSSSGVLALVGLGLWLVWRKRPLFAASPPKAASLDG